MAEYMCIGDRICLHSEDNNGFLMGPSSSSVFNYLRICQNQDMDCPEEVDDMQAYIFEICICKRYKLFQKFQKLYKNIDENSVNFSSKFQMDQAKAVVLSEENDNNLESIRNMGKQIQYGDVIQLRHVLTNRYIHVDESKTGEMEKNNMMTQLEFHNSKSAYFRITPRHKAKFEVEAVQYNDSVKFESMKCVSQYLHGSKPFQVDNLFFGSELNIASEPSGFKAIRSVALSTVLENESFLKGGDYIQIIHKEIDAYLESENDGDVDTKADVFLRPRKTDTFPSSSSLRFSLSPTTFWQIEHARTILSAEVCEWSQHFRIRHSLSRLYLSVKKDLTVVLTKNCYDRSTIFQFAVRNCSETNIRFSSYCRLQNIATGAWLHTKKNEIWFKDGYKSQSQFQKSRDDLRQLFCASKKLYDDAFVLYQVPLTFIKSFNQISGYVPFIRNLLEERKNQKPFDLTLSTRYKSALEEISRDLKIRGQPNKINQRLLRNFRIIDILVELVLIPFIDALDEKYGRKVYWECYEILHNFLKGSTMKNSLYFAKYINLFNEKMLENNDLGNKIMEMVTELLRNNEAIMQCVKFEYLVPFIESVKTSRNAQFIEYLCVFCTCNGIPIVENQRRIAERWLKKNAGGVFMTDRGQNMELEYDVLYIMTDFQSGWTKLHEFLEDTNAPSGRRDKDHFMKQLDLFIALCYGRNLYCMDLIIRCQNFLSWDECFAGIKSPLLPYYMRRKYFEIIQTIYIDVGSNYSVIDNPKYNFKYSEVRKETPIEMEMLFARPNEKTTMSIFTELSQWIFEFLESLPCMIESEKEQNYFLEMILIVTNNLVRYGYYDSESLRRIVKCLQTLLNGKLDLPFQYDIISDTNKEKRSIVMTYRNKQRYVYSPATQAIISAKLAGLDIIDSIFTYERALIVSQFLHRFNVCDQGSGVYLASQDEQLTTLGPCLDNEFNIDEYYQLHRKKSTLMLTEIDGMLKNTIFVDPSHWTEILVDLSYYESDLINQKSLHLLRKMYTIKESGLLHAFQSYISRTPQSESLQDKLTDYIPSLRLMAKSAIEQEQIERILVMLKDIICAIRIPKTERDLNPIAQRIVASYGTMEISFELITQIYRSYEKTQMPITAVRLVSIITELLRLLTISNPSFKENLFNQLDTLLDLYPHSHPTELVDLLRDGIFLDNAEYCGRLKSYQINKLVLLAARYAKSKPLLGSAFLHLLQSVSAVNYGELAIKKNQLFVMKFMMKHFSQIAFLLDSNYKPRTVLLTTNSKSDEAVYFIRFIDFLCSCCQGDNQYVQSLCQTILSMEEVVEILANDDIDIIYKRGLMKYLANVYISKSVSTNQDSIIREFLDSSHSEDLFDGIHGKLIAARDLLSKLDQVELLTVLKKTFLLKIPTVSQRIETVQSSLHYVISGVAVLMSSLCTAWSALNIALSKEINDKVTAINDLIINIFSQIWKFQLHPGMFMSMTESLIQIVAYSTLTDGDAKAITALHCKTTCSDADPRLEIDGVYSVEMELNLKMQTFMFNCHQIICGRNSLKAQLNVNSERRYASSQDSTSLPVSVEFQRHINCFTDQNYSKSDKKYYKYVEILIKQLEVSGQIRSRSRHYNLGSQGNLSQLDQDALDLRSHQILRGLIYNVECLSSDTGDDNDEETWSQDSLKTIKQIQNFLNEMNLSSRTQIHMINPCDAVRKQSLSLQSAMLMNGNPNVQETILSYFKKSVEEVFFNSIKEQLQNAFEDIKNQKQIVPQKRTAIDRKRYGLKETDVNIGMLANILYYQIEDYEKRQKRQYQCQVINESFEVRLLSNIKTDKKTSKCPSICLLCCKKAPKKKLKRSKGKETGGAVLNDYEMTDFIGSVGERDVEASVENLIMTLDDESTTSKGNVGVPQNSVDADTARVDPNQQVKLVLQIISRMCIGQFVGLQNYLREQPDNRISVDVISIVVNFLGSTYSNLQPDNIALIIMAFDAIKEAVLGNQDNRKLVFQAKVVDYANFIIRSGDILDNCGVVKTMNLWMVVSKTIIAIIEENGPIETPFAKDVTSTLDKTGIEKTMDDCCNMLKDPLFAKYKSKIYKVGFNYFRITVRLGELKPNISAKDQHLEPETKAFQFFKRTASSIEILKGEYLQRITFSVKNPEILREDVREKIKWAVDRTSPRNKIRSFMEWSKLIVPDMKFQKRLNMNPILRPLVKQGMALNLLILLLSVVINILLIVGVRAPDSGFIGLTGPLPTRDTNFDNYKMTWIDGYQIYETVVKGLGLVHTFTASLLWILYLITDKPSLVTIFGYVRSVKFFIKKFLNRIDEDDETSYETNTAAVSMFSVFQFLYLSLSLALSIYGLYVPYCYAFHLFNIIQNNQLLMGVIASVTRNGRILIWVAVLLVIVMYIFTIFAFCLYRSVFNPGVFWYSKTFYQAFATIVRFGIVGDIYQNMLANDAERTTIDSAFNRFGLILIFQLLFYISITITGMNIIFGIIVDTFSELRNLKDFAEFDMKDVCFICSRPGYDFEQSGRSFRYHINNEHNMWAYFFYFYYLETVKPNDYFNLDLYVSNMMLKKKYDFFPINRSLCLMKDFAEESRIDQIYRNVEFIIENRKREEKEKLKRKQVLSQARWQRRVHRPSVVGYLNEENCDRESPSEDKQS